MSQDKTAKAARHASWWKAMRVKLLSVVGRGVVQCVYCGCDDPDLLEVNHKNGGGRAEFANSSAPKVYRSILSGERSVEDLEVACSICNVLHRQIMRLNRPLGYVITWEKPGGPR